MNTKPAIMSKIILNVLAALLVGALMFGLGWCNWKGYKERHPTGRCIGFVTQPSR